MANDADPLQVLYRFMPIPSITWRRRGRDFEMVDFNRAGVPLLEIVGKPDLRSADDAKAYVAELRAVASDARGIIADINSGKGNLGLMVRDDALYREATNTLFNVREIAQKVNGGQGTVGKLVNDDSFYKNVKVSLQKLDKAAEGLEDQGPLSVLGIAIGTLF